MRVMARVEGEPRDVTVGGRLGELYRIHAADGIRLAYLLTGNRATAEDLVQEAFVRLYGRFRDLRDPGAFEWYLRRTIVNLVRSQFRRLRVERSYLESRGRERRPVAEPPDPGAHEELWRAPLEPPERQRTAVVLPYYEDPSPAPTPPARGCPLGPPKAPVSRGTGRLP